MSEDRESGHPAPGRDVADRGEREPDQRGATVRRTQELLAGFARVGPAYHPIFDKFGHEHVTQFLKQTHEDNQEKRRFLRSGRWFRLAYAVLGLAAFVSLTLFLLPDHADLYFEILQGVGIFAAGIAGGYGLKSYQDLRRD